MKWLLEGEHRQRGEAEGLSKLQLRKRYELMRYAIQRGLDRAP